MKKSFLIFFKITTILLILTYFLLSILSYTNINIFLSDKIKIISKNNDYPVYEMDMREDLKYIVEYNKIFNKYYISNEKHIYKEIEDTEFIINDISSQFKMSKSKENIEYLKQLLSLKASKENFKIYLRTTTQDVEQILKLNTVKIDDYNRIKLIKTLDMVMFKDNSEKNLEKKYKSKKQLSLF